MATHQLLAQPMIPSRASCILYVAVVAYSYVHQSTRSSAYRAAWIPLGGSGTRSLMKSMNRVDDNTPPCGTACRSGTFWTQCPSTITLALRLCEYDLVHRNMLPLMPLRWSFTRRPSFHTMSCRRPFGDL